MATDYKFLRFESAGTSTILYLILIFLPVSWDEIQKFLTLKLDTIIALIAAIFLFSLPIGYLGHQLIVNKHRSEHRNRLVHDLINEKIIKYIKEYNSVNNTNIDFNLNEIEKSSFISSFLDLLLYQKDVKTDKDIHDRLSNLWSYYYGRKAVGIYAPMFALSLYTIICFFIYMKYLNVNINLDFFIHGLIIGFIIFIIGLFVIDPYTKKIWCELNYLEAQIIIVDENEVQKIISKMVIEFENHQQLYKIHEKNIFESIKELFKIGS